MSARSRLRGVVGRGALAVALSALGTAASAEAGGAQQGEPGGAAEGPAELHGAAPTSEQLRRLDALLPEADVAAPPRGVDPEIWEALVPDDNEMTPERVELGRKLYFDRRLSADGTVSCSTCHDPTRSFTDRRPVSEGIGGQLGHRNAPTVMNAAFMTTQFWDGRAPSLEEQAKLPILNPIEMGQPEPATALAAIADLPEYQQGFQEAYGRDPNYEDLARAIAAFERTLIFMDSPFDRFLAGEEDAISAEERRGFELFLGKGRCMTCHVLNPSNPVGVDQRFHNIGVAARHQDFEKLARRALSALEEGSAREVDRLALATDLSELGRFLVTKSRADIGAFKTEQIRNIGITAPYMHDGSMQTLWDVMDHYNKGGEANPYLDGGIVPLALSEDEIDAVVAFMFALTDDRFAEESRAERERQRALAAEQRPFRDEALAMRRAIPFEARVERGRDTADPMEPKEPPEDGQETPQ